jgi:hypothetical protein
MIKERPILFSAPMVRALLDGTKTQTRRAWREQPPVGVKVGYVPGQTKSPYGAVTDRLWVREAFAKIDGQTQPWIETDYRATYTHGDRLGDTLGIKKRWTPSIFMPRNASRINLEITEVRVERLQDISAADALSEGIKINIDAKTKQPLMRMTGKFPPAQYIEGNGLVIAEYASLWESINGPGSWVANPWVWAVSFKVIKP